METMTEQGHLESAAYMIRNLYIGDEEQTRIADEGFLSELPDDLATGCKYLLSKEGGRDYDGAIHIYARWHLRQVCDRGYNWDKYKEDFKKACNQIFDSLWDIGDYQDDSNCRNRSKEELEEIEEDRDQINEWMKYAETVILG